MLSPDYAVLSLSSRLVILRMLKCVWRIREADIVVSRLAPAGPQQKEGQAKSFSFLGQLGQDQRKRLHRIPISAWPLWRGERGKEWQRCITALSSSNLRGHSKIPLCAGQIGRQFRVCAGPTNTDCSVRVVERGLDECLFFCAQMTTMNIYLIFSLQTLTDPPSPSVALSATNWCSVVHNAATETYMTYTCMLWRSLTYFA